MRAAARPLQLLRAFAAAALSVLLLGAAYAVPWLHGLAWLGLVPLLLSTRTLGRLGVLAAMAAFGLGALGAVAAATCPWRPYPPEASAVRCGLDLLGKAGALVVLAAVIQLLGRRLGRWAWVAPPVVWTLLLVSCGALAPNLAQGFAAYLAIVPVSQPVFRLVAGTALVDVLFLLVLLVNYGLAEGVSCLRGARRWALTAAALAGAVALGLAGGPVADLPRSRPEEQGMDARVLSAMGEEIPRSSLFRQIRSVVVVRHRHVVFERYYGGGPETPQVLNSVTKSVTGALVGIAIARGVLRGDGQAIAELLPGQVTPAMDPRARAVTVRHLVTMTSGLGSGRDDGFLMVEQPDWVAFALQLPVARPPGAKFSYSTPAVHLLSAALNAGSGLRGTRFADRHLFGPLGIYRRSWWQDPAGNPHGGAGLLLRARDLAKLGQLYLDHGKWEGEQLLPAEWVAASTRVQSEGGAPHGEPYGYLMWIVEGDEHGSYFAGGYGGQFVYVVPGLDLVAVITSSCDEHHEQSRSIVPRYVIPAVVR